MFIRAIIVLQIAGGTVRWRMKIEKNFNKTSSSHLKNGNRENYIFLENSPSRRSRQGQIFRPILINFISRVVEALLLIVTYQEFPVMQRLLTVASLSSTIFEFIDFVEVILNIDKPHGARW